MLTSISMSFVQNVHWPKLMEARTCRLLTIQGDAFEFLNCHFSFRQKIFQIFSTASFRPTTLTDFGLFSFCVGYCCSD